MEKLNYKPVVRKILADTVTPVSIYLRLRTLYPKSIFWKVPIIMETKMPIHLSVLAQWLVLRLITEK